MKAIAILEVGVGKNAGRGVFRFIRDDYQVFVCDAVVVKPFALGRYRLVPSIDGGRQILFLVKRASDSGFRTSDLGLRNADCGYIGDGGGREFGNADFGVRIEDLRLGIEDDGEVSEDVKKYGLGYVVLGYGYVDKAGLLNRSVAISELWQAMLLLPHCEFEVKEGKGVGDES